MHRRLDDFMEAAASRLQQVSLDDDEPGHCARLVMATPSSWRAWEHEFRDSLSRCTQYTHRAWQQRGLRACAMTWVHRSAPFRYMRDHNVRGEARRRLINGFHGDHSFSRAMIVEHGHYVRGVCNTVCSEHIGGNLLGDVLLAKSVHRYEVLYMQYFSAYCAATMPEVDTEEFAGRRELLPMLKRQIYDLRQAILEYPMRRDWLDREATIRQPTGETARMQRFILADAHPEL